MRFVLKPHSTHIKKKKKKKKTGGGAKMAEE